jgi:hypothetical protein
MKRISFAVAAAIAVAALPANATVIPAGSSGLATQSFGLISGTQGTMIASTSVPGSAFSFSTLVNSAVYRNTLGTLDFYYQVSRTGPGALSNETIKSFTASNFRGYSVNGYLSLTDPDGAGFFSAINNPGPATSTFGRSADAKVLRVDFGSNVLSGLERSGVYVFRTDATRFTTGTFGVIDGSTFAGLAFAPAAIPEPGSWAMLIVGFGMVGAVSRRRNRAVTA